jgi:hypothetical protein
MSDSLKLRVAQLEWASQSAAGKLTGQLTRDELIETLSKSQRLQEKMGDRLGWFLKKARLLDLEKLYREESDASHSPASGRLRGFGWVDRTILGQTRPFEEVNGEHGEQLFRHVPYAFFLPTTLSRSAMEAQKRGEPTVVEAYLMLFAWVEWLILSRPLLWAPTTPTPSLLSVLVESFGIGPEIHRNDPERLSRLAARLPTWYAHRGGTERSRQILEDTVGIPLGVELVDCDTHGERPRNPPLTEEVFACRSAEWWNRRSDEGGGHIPAAGESASMRIADGLLRYQGNDRAFPLVREDVVVSLEKGNEFPVILFRVLPLWASIRIIVLPTGD